MNTTTHRLVSLVILMLTPVALMATDYSDDIHKNDYKWLNFNLMYALEELPRMKESDHKGHDYFELEFGGRSGIVDLYGYVDIFNLTNSSGSDKKGASKAFMKFAPRLSLDAITGKDLSFGPVQELYAATLFNWGGGGATNFDDKGNAVTGEDVNNSFWGIGSDIMVPWLGKIGLNLYALYDLNKKEWNGYQVSTNWFKPFYTFENDTFLSYQGYIDYQFGAKTEDNPASNYYDRNFSTHGGAMFNGLYWHSEHFAIGYGLKLYSDIYLIKDGGDLMGPNNTKSKGVSHYFDITYKF